MSVNVVCMKFGNRYGANYVNNLYRGVRRHLSRPFVFYCFTDDRSGLDPGIEVRDYETLLVHESMRRTVYTKYSIMHSLSGLKGPTLFLDIDILLLDSIDALFDYAGERFCIIRNWYSWWKNILRARPDIGNSSVFRFQGGECDHVLERYLRDPSYVDEAFPTEQAFLTDCMRDEKAYWPSEWIQSFKHNCCHTFPLNLVRKPTIRPDTSILVFHGRPDPDQAIDGFRGRFRKRTLPMPELADHWSGLSERETTGRVTVHHLAEKPLIPTSLDRNTDHQERHRPCA